ncbi:MAG: GntR family transcriptional regulator [Peptostreptococcaceae bacterium]|nr:GntR family transcriptional regulator [Peptostreptococcaceae bacterium]
MRDGISKLGLENYKPLREIVFEHLRQSILTGKLEPSQRLMEVQLAEELGVSRTPVREAIRKLELEGLVVMIPRKGAYVADVSLKDIIEVLEIRSALEGLAASLCASRMDEESLNKLKKISDEFEEALKFDNVELMVEKDIAFHDLIFKSTSNDKLIQMNNSLREQVYRFRVMYISDFDKSNSLINEHKSIVKALMKKDSKGAMELSMKHIDNAQNFIVEKSKDSKILKMD